MKQRNREAMRIIKIRRAGRLSASFLVMFRVKRRIRFSQIPLGYT